MEHAKLPHYVDLYLDSGFWKLRADMDSINALGLEKSAWRDPAWIGPATGPDRLTRKQVQQAAWESILARMNPGVLALKSAMTIAEFVESKFVPEHVLAKGIAGRTHYQALLKHILTPEEVQRIFRVDMEQSRGKLKAVPGWPYLGSLRLNEVRARHVEELVLAASDRGYSTQTVTHIRNVVSAIYTHAQKEHCFHGDNPASQVTPPSMSRKEAHALTLSQTKALLETMRYPEREMTVVAILTDMSVAEICGLQWKYVNIAPVPVEVACDTIPPGTIQIRKQWYRGELSDVKKVRVRDLPVPGAMFPILLKLSSRPRFTGPDDFVFVSQAGTPINETNVASRRLKRIGKELHMPWLSWQVLRRTHKNLLSRFGMDYQGRIATVVCP
jgi:site-specific recombinase XerC